MNPTDAPNSAHEPWTDEERIARLDALNQDQGARESAAYREQLADEEAFDRLPLQARIESMRRGAPPWFTPAEVEENLEAYARGEADRLRARGE